LYDNEPYNPNPLAATTLYEEAPVQHTASPISPTSPRKQPTRVLPSSLLTPDILGETPEDSLKKAFVKSSSSTKSPAAEAKTATPAKSMERSASQSKATPYVFRPGINPKAKKSASTGVSRSGSFNDQKEQRDEEVRKADITEVEAETGTSSESAKELDVHQEVDGAKEEERAPEVPTKASESSHATETKDGRKDLRAGSLSPVIESSRHTSPPVPPRVAEQILTADDPIAKSLDVVRGDSSSNEDKHDVDQVTGLVKDLMTLPPLPHSEQVTPRAVTPVAQGGDADVDQHVIGERSQPPSPSHTTTEPFVATSPSPETPHKSSVHSRASNTSPRSSTRLDKVTFSPLEQPQQADPYERGFSAFSIGGVSTYADGSSSAGATQPSWGKSFDEPEAVASPWGPSGDQAYPSSTAGFHGGEAEQPETTTWGDQPQHPQTSGRLAEVKGWLIPRSLEATTDR
jgi:hypothetical protein